MTRTAAGRAWDVTFMGQEVFIVRRCLQNPYAVRSKVGSEYPFRAFRHGPELVDMGFFLSFGYRTASLEPYCLAAVLQDSVLSREDADRSSAVVCGHDMASVCHYEARVGACLKQSGCLRPVLVE